MKEKQPEENTAIALHKDYEDKDHRNMNGE